MLLGCVGSGGYQNGERDGSQKEQKSMGSQEKIERDTTCARETEDEEEEERWRTDSGRMSRLSRKRQHYQARKEEKGEGNSKIIEE